MIATALWAFVWLINGLVLAYFVLLNSVYLATSLLAIGALRRYAQRARVVDLKEILRSGAAPPVTVIAPAYNEEATCVESVRSLLSLNYPDHQVLVVNDGSDDATLERLVEAFDMEPIPRMPMADLDTAPVHGTFRSRWHPNLWLIDKDNGGKADALNAGLAFCQTPLFCAIDMDTLVERDALARVVWPFLEDTRTIAAGGIIRIANGCRVEDGIVTDVRLPRSWLARFQALEYLRAFLSARMGWEAVQSLLIISGAFGIFRRSAVVEAGGFWTQTIGEDMELVVRLHRTFRERGIPYRIHSLPEAVAWTEAPETFSGLAGQRDRWQRGLTESLVRHRTMLGNPRYGRIGTVAYPYFYFLEMLGPVIEVLGYGAFIATVLLGWASTAYIIAFIMVAVVLGIILSMAAVGLGELTYRRYPRTSDLLRLFWIAVIENFGYRQLNSYWRVRGMWNYVTGRGGWGARSRKGFDSAPSTSSVARGLLFLAALGLGAPAGLEAQSQAPGPWEAGLSYEHVDHGGDGGAWDEAWTELRASLLRDGGTATVIFEAGTVERFGQRDAFAGVDAYADLRPGSYVNVRFRTAPGADATPREDLSFEAFQAFGNGFEAAAGARLMRFPDETTPTFSAALARYHDRFYLRARVLISPREDRRGTALVGQIRYMLGDDDLIEAVASAGREVVTVGEGPVVELRDTHAAVLRGVRYVSARVGIDAAVLLRSFQGAPRGVGGSLGLRFRW